MCKEEEENGRRDEKKFLSLRKFIIVTDEVIPIKTIVGSLSHHILSYKLFHEYISNNHSFKDTFFLIRRGKIRNIIIQHFQNFSVLSRICVIKQRLLRLNIQYFARINPLNINNCSNRVVQVSLKFRSKIGKLARCYRLENRFYYPIESIRS